MQQQQQQSPAAAAVAKPVAPPQADNKPTPSSESVNELTAELSNLSTKVEPIKEKEDEEEWEKKDNGDEVGDDEIIEDEIASAEVAARPKKQIVIREYKPKKEPVNIIFCGHVDAGIHLLLVFYPRFYFN